MYALKLQTEASKTVIFEEDGFNDLAKALATQIKHYDEEAEKIIDNEYFCDGFVSYPEEDGFCFDWPIDVVFFHKLLYYKNTRCGITPGEAVDIVKLHEKYTKLHDEDLNNRWQLLARMHQRAVDEDTILLILD